MPAASAFPSLLTPSIPVLWPPYSRICRWMKSTTIYLGELHTVTRPGGRVFCSVFCAAETPYRQDQNLCHDRAAFVTAVEQRGFSWELKGAFKTGSAHNWYLLTKT